MYKNRIAIPCKNKGLGFSCNGNKNHRKCANKIPIVANKHVYNFHISYNSIRELARYDTKLPQPSG